MYKYAEDSRRRLTSTTTATSEKGIWVGKNGHVLGWREIEGEREIERDR